MTGYDRAARPTVEVAHEALIRTWPRLRTWIDANREKLRARGVVLQAKADWEQSGRRDDMLLPIGLQLERASSLLADPGDTPIDDIKEFIQLSSERKEAALKQAADAQRKRARIRNIAFVIVSIFAVLAGWLYWNAEQQRQVAEEQRAAAEEHRKAAEVQRQQADHILEGATNIIRKLSNQMDNDTKKEMFTLFQTGADRGDATSMRNLGITYEIGHGVAQDYARARDWYEKAAAKGDARAMYNLGLFYQNGQGVAQDYAKAREWYEKAADKGEAEAMTNLGWLYQYGQGVWQDYVKARDWYERAAANGYANAMSNLGWLYQNGQGVAQDYAKAREWYEKAAAKGDANAMFFLGRLYESGAGVAQDYAKARDWYEKAAASGVAKVREWFEKAADKGEAEAMTNLGVLYEKGYGVTQDHAKAREWFEKAADKGEAEAMTNLGWLYQNGQGGAQDYAKARELYEKAADQGNARAMAYLEKLPIKAAAGAGRYAEALQLQEALAAKVEVVETEREGKPGEETAQALNSVAWYAMFAREFTKALTVADRARALFRDDLMIETNRVHALMFLGRGEDAKALHLAHKGEPLSEQDARLWERVIADDFAEFRKAGLTDPMMADIEKELGVSP